MQLKLAYQDYIIAIVWHRTLRGFFASIMVAALN